MNSVLLLSKGTGNYVYATISTISVEAEFPGGTWLEATTADHRYLQILVESEERANELISSLAEQSCVKATVESVSFLR